MALELHTLDKLPSLSPQEIRERFGGKLLGLYEAHQLGIRIPTTWMMSTAVYQEFLKTDPPQEVEAFRKKAVDFIGSFDGLEEGLYAVRSSSQGEDASNHSYAGVFETELNVPKEKIAEAVAFVWSSSLLEKAKNYQEVPQLMGVLIQPMIQAKWAGVCFTRHPSPRTLFENHHMVIEFAESGGDKVVGGEVTPQRLSGTPDQLSTVSESAWVNQLLEATFALKKHYSHEADIEFAIDPHETFWLLQQRPISKVYPSKTLDLSGYHRMYKRSLLSLDIELLIDGCSRFLAPYLEVPMDLEQWMVMTTNSEGIQELWIDKVLNETLLQAVIDKVEQDPTYLPRIEKRYRDHYDRLTGPQPLSLLEWFEWMTPFAAHYYVPMIMIDALHTSLLHEFESHDLFELSTSGIASIFDLLNAELCPLKGQPFEACKEKLQELAERFGFIKCREPYEDPYSPEELFEMIPDAQPPSPQKNPNHSDRLTRLREWMRIRNQEMEYLLFAFLKARPLIDQTCQELAIDGQTFWRSTKMSLLQGKPLQVASPTIVQNQGHTTVSDQIEVRLPSLSSIKDLKGHTVYGTGTLEATVYVLFSPKDLLTPPKGPTVLVTGMTTPDFVPLIRKHFVALITDEGGLLCHAAILAREIPIPCIVGTGSASDLLKTGTQVSIDFDRGEITKIDQQ